MTSDADLIAQAASMIRAQDLSGWSSAHDRVVLDALEALEKAGPAPVAFETKVSRTKRLYLTQRVEEFFMGVFQLQLGLIAAYFAFDMNHWFMRLLLAEASLAGFALSYVFLFTMRGSRERREAKN